MNWMIFWVAVTAICAVMTFIVYLIGRKTCLFFICQVCLFIYLIGKICVPIYAIVWLVSKIFIRCYYISVDKSDNVDKNKGKIKSINIDKKTYFIKNKEKAVTDNEKYIKVELEKYDYFGMKHLTEKEQKKYEKVKKRVESSSRWKIWACRQMFFLKNDTRLEKREKEKNEYN